MKPYPTYKASNIEWLGDIPEHWEVSKLKHSVKLNNHLQFDNEENVNTKIALENIESNTGKIINLHSNTFEGIGNIFKKGDVLFGKLRPYLAKVISPNFEGNCVNEILVLTPNSQSWNSIFLKYILLSKRVIDIIDNSTFGAKMPRANWDFIGSLKLPSPNIKEQNNIVNYIDNQTRKIDHFIQKKQQLIQLLQEQKAAIINQAVTKGIQADVKMKPSGIDWFGDIPAHWQMKKLKYLGKFQNGVSAGAEYFGKGFPFISYGDVYKNFELPNEVSGLANSSEKDRQLYSIIEGDILFTRTSETIEEIGITSTCLNTIENATFSGFLIRFRPFKGLLEPIFSKFYFRSELHRMFFVKEMNLVTRASLSQTLLKQMPVIIPPKKEQREIGSFIEIETEKIHKAINQIEKEISLVQEYRTALIAEAVTGKIDVRDYSLIQKS